MKSIFHQLRSSILAVLVLALVCCGLYPLLVFAAGQVLFPHEAIGSLIVDASGSVRGSELFGQQFTSEKYFHTRPSAAGAGYDGGSSSGSNLGPTSQKLSDAIKERIAIYRKENGLKETDPVPADAVTASGSGLDPHISITNAELQIPRVVKARNLTEGQVRKLVEQHAEGRDLGALGEPRINVVKLNMALDQLKGRPEAEFVRSK